MSSAPQSFFPIDFKTRFPALDGVRALAILLVFASHFGGGSHGGRLLNFASQLRLHGWVGVDLFFVLSGFLITGILYDTRHDSHFFKRFFARRSARIFPAFYLAAVVLLLLTPVFHYQWRPGHLAFLVFLGNLPANRDFDLYQVVSANHPTAKVFLGHLWSLCVEEQFYLVWSLLVFLIRDRVKLLWTAAGLSLLALLLRLVMVLHFSPQFAETWIIRSLPFRFDTLLLGGILALLLRGPAASAARWQRASVWLFAAGAAATLAIFYLSPAYDSPWLLTVGLTAIALAGAGLIGSTLIPAAPAARLLALRPLRTLGRYSYGFYLYHVLFGWAWLAFLVFVIGQVHSLALAGLICLPIDFAIIFLVSKFSYDLFEVRFLRLKTRFEYDSELTHHKHAFTAKERPSQAVQ